MFYLSKVSKKLTDIIEGKVTTEEDVFRFFNTEIIEYFQKSILCGEHYYDAINHVYDIIDEQISAIEVLCGNESEYSWKVLERRTKLVSIVRRAKIEFFSPARELSKIVNENLSSFNDGRLKNSLNFRRYQRFFLQDTSNIDPTIIADDETANSIVIEKIFKTNIFLAYVDEDIYCSEQMSEDLRMIKRALKGWQKKLSNNYDEIFKVLLDKIDFLKFKINYRGDHFKDDNSIGSEREPFSIDQNNRFYSFYTEIKYHYSKFKKDDEKKLYSEANAVLSKPRNSRVLGPFYHLKRHFSKKEKELSDAKNKIESLNKKVIDTFTANDENLHLFDKVAWKTTNNLLYNASLQLELDIEAKNKYERILKDFKKYKKLHLLISSLNTADESAFGTQSIPYLLEIKIRIDKMSKENDIQDFHLDIIFLDFLIKMISFFKSSPNTIIELYSNDDIVIKSESKHKKVSDIVEFVTLICDRCLIDLNRKFKFVFSYKSLPVYLTFSECFDDLVWVDGQRLFLRSSCILPQDFTKIKNKIQSLEILVLSQKTALKDIFEISFSQAEIKSEFNSFEKRIKDNEIKVVQIVGLFVTIATFILSNVKIFEGKSGIESYGIVLGLLTCFLVFNLFIYFMVLPDPLNKKLSLYAGIKYVVFIALTVGLGILSYILLGRETDKANEPMKTIEKRMNSISDSVKQSYEIVGYKLDSTKQKLKADSLAFSKTVTTLNNSLNTILKKNKDTATDKK